MSDIRHLTVEQVAERLALSEETVRRWLRSGKLKGVRIGERRSGWRVPETEVQRILSGGRPDSAK
jgi:excisionase family DNA binding protein